MFIDIHTHSAVADGSSFRLLNLHSDFGRVAAGMPCSVGVHPCHLAHYNELLAELAQTARCVNVLAIGECGLDNMCNQDMALQLFLFRQQVALAVQHSKPLIIHCVRAFNELLNFVKDLSQVPPMIVHGYNKKQEIAHKLLDTGMYLSFGAAILNESWPAANVLSHIPANRFFLETDDATISIREIYQQAASIRNTPLETLILQQQQNFELVFKHSL